MTLADLQQVGRLPVGVTAGVIDLVKGVAAVKRLALTPQLAEPQQYR